MKTMFLLLTTTAIAISSCAQDIPASSVPAVVQNTVQAKFSNAANTEWEKKNSFYEAEFKVNKTEYTVQIDEAGKLVIYKMDIALADLPAVIKAAISRDYAGYDIDDAEKLEKDGITYYQAELESKGKEDVKLVFTTTGAIAPGIAYME